MYKIFSQWCGIVLLVVITRLLPSVKVLQNFFNTDRCTVRRIFMVIIHL
jgi:hypothetical protein